MTVSGSVLMVEMGSDKLFRELDGGGDAAYKLK
jgi:hypothetical protein